MTEPISGFAESLTTPTPESGFELAIKLPRLGVKAAQPNSDMPKQLCPECSVDAGDLTAYSQTIALHYQTIAAANDYGRATKGGAS